MLAVFVILAVVLGIAFLTEQPGAILALCLSPVFLMVIALQLGAAIDGAHPESAPLPSSFSGRADWPLYTVLVPLRSEARVIAQLCAAMRALDYPPDALEIFFLVEPDDPVTVQALYQEQLPAWMTIVVVPPGNPRTKPRALNHGLALASGVYVTVYDAEDIPDIDQLKLAVHIFETAPPDVICLQAHLAIDNAPDSWFALMVCIEYAALFEAIKRGLSRSRLPVALGGTSNHFRRAVLLQLGGWDAFNVTEDADLGLRIARQKGFVQDLPSTTLEEAPIRFRSWFGQRRRWMKGWIQTGICHSRQPRRAIREMGFINWLAAMGQVFGIVLGSLLFPFFQLWFVWNIWQGSLLDNSTGLKLISNSLSVVIFLTGFCAIVIPAIIGLIQRRSWHLVPWLLTYPFYIMLISLASFYAIADFMRQPFYWEKTEHGLGRRRPDAFRSRR
ncbi:MAG: glycosyltransferase [Beijerinckiaceae bacterium]